MRVTVVSASSSDGYDWLNAPRLTRQAEVSGWYDRRQLRVTREMRSFSQYLLTDEGPVWAFQSGLTFANGKPKPALDAYRPAAQVVVRTAPEDPALAAFMAAADRRMLMDAIGCHF